MRDETTVFSSNKNDRPNIDESSKVGDASRSVSVTVWLLLFLTSVATFAGFIALDPNPSLLLSVCVAINVAIMGWAMLRLYQLDLLLSPMMLIFIGPTMFMYYSWGNLGSRIAGETRYIANFNTLEYYPLTALLSTIGLLLYCLVVFGFFSKSLRSINIRFQDLYWKPSQAFGAMFFVLAIFVYLSFKYSFVSGYFRGAENNFDRWLIATMNSFVTLIAIISISLLAKAEEKYIYVLALFGIAISLILTIGLRSRTFMLVNLIIMSLCWLTLKPKQAKLPFFLVLSLVGGVVFGLGTVVKTFQGRDVNSISGNLSLFSSIDSSEIVSVTARGIGIDRQYRTAGFELPSAILRCLEHGAQPAYGKGFEGAFYQGLPGFLRPPGIYNERNSITLHYWRYCFFYGDSIAIPMVSGISDWGVLGAFVYVLFGVFSILLWKIAQRSPRLYLAYLLVPLLPDQLFWTEVFHYVKTMTFLWLLLWVAGTLLMPYWSQSLPPQRLSNTE